MKLTTLVMLRVAVTTTAVVRGGGHPVWVRGGELHAVPNEIKLYYGDMPFWRAECVRLALFIGGIPFVDVRDESREALKAAGKMPFGAVPVLEVDGKVLSQTQAMALRDELVEEGYTVWMDVDRMMGSTLEAMAAAIESSDAIVMCVTNRYKESQACRTEAEYA